MVWVAVLSPPNPLLRCCDWAVYVGKSKHFVPLSLTITLHIAVVATVRSCALTYWLCVGEIHLSIIWSTYCAVPVGLGAATQRSHPLCSANYHCTRSIACALYLHCCQLQQQNTLPPCRNKVFFGLGRTVDAMQTVCVCVYQDPILCVVVPRTVEFSYSLSRP
jgi:hypothetical protein